MPSLDVQLAIPAHFARKYLRCRDPKQRNPRWSNYLIPRRASTVPRYLLRFAELELIDREGELSERRIREARSPAVKSLDSFEPVPDASPEVT